MFTSVEKIVRPMLCKKDTFKRLQRQILMAGDKEELFRCCEFGSQNVDSCRFHLVVHNHFETFQEKIVMRLTCLGKAGKHWIEDKSRQSLD